MCFQKIGYCLTFPILITPGVGGLTLGALDASLAAGPLEVSPPDKLHVMFQMNLKVSAWCVKSRVLYSIAELQSVLGQWCQRRDRRGISKPPQSPSRSFKRIHLAFLLRICPKSTYLWPSRMSGLSGMVKQL